MILHVPLISQNNVYSIFLKLLKMYMTVPLMQFIVSNGKEATVSVHLFLNPRFLSRSLSGWYRKWYWVAPDQWFKTPIRYQTKIVQTCQCIISIHQNNKFESIDKPHFIERLQVLRNILLFPPISIIDVQFSNS